MNTTLQPDHPAPTRRRSRFDTGAAALWASAFVLLALILTQAGRLTEPVAYAGEVDDIGQMKLLTAQSGNNEEFIAVLNSSDETISIYGIENARSLELYQVQSLRELFLGLSRATGAPRR